MRQDVASSRKSSLTSQAAVGALPSASTVHWTDLSMFLITLAVPVLELPSGDELPGAHGLASI